MFSLLQKKEPQKKRSVKENGKDKVEGFVIKTNFFTT